MLIQQATLKLLEYCRAEEWAGHDPYDALTSPLARFLPGRAARIAFTQLVKRSQFNLRPLLGISKGLNSKGIALAARAVLLLNSEARSSPVPGSAGTYEAGQLRFEKAALDSDFKHLMRTLLSLRIRNYDEACWGYNFPWQSRAFYAPEGMPNVVCTVFAANTYLDWYEASNDERVLEVGVSSARFLMDRINKTIDGDTFCFSYTPGDQACVHNVNLLAAELLSRVYSVTGSEEFRDAAISAARFSINRQRPDGSWPYGEADNQPWIDNFHTAFILVSLNRIIKFLGQPGWAETLRAGYRFYIDRFFLADGRPKYYHNKLFPVDTHSAAAAIVALVELGDWASGSLEMAEKVMKWMLANMQDPAGFFYYQRHRFHTAKISYIRWTQAWMLYACACYLAGVRVRQNG
ncbi:MAG TPA: hypothetical protein VKJ45_01725 [Blastocatellia bacterium]|nr:hypothetical protein [Blastocatellia bacterium]